MWVEVFKSTRKPETYVYLERGADWSALPESLRKVFGEPESVLSLMLKPERQLARYSGAYVLERISQQGFFLQMPDQEAEPC